MGKGAVLVVGGGVAGVQAALDLAAGGFYVHLVERGPAIGGVMAQLDKTFPTNDCSMCILSPKLVEVGRELNVNLLTLTEVLEVAGEPGNFRVRLRKHPRYVDESKCIACGQCATKCPKQVPNEFDRGLSKRKAIYLLYPQAVPLKYTIDPRHCIWLKKPGRCGFCAKVCPAGAIDFEQRPEEIELKVGAVILAPGFETFDPSPLENFGYRRLPYVMTAHEFERLLSASGPTKGELVRLPDGRIPRKIAWIQCVGSRDINRAKVPYCSSVCCMYALKQAVIAKEHVRGDFEPVIFYMDLRTMGKGFEAYLERAKREGVRLVRSRIHTILPNEEALVLHYIDEHGTSQDETFDLVVLSVGLRPHPTLPELADHLSVSRDEFGFLKAELLENRPGFFVCGAGSGPKDIPETVTEASAAAAKAEVLLAEARGTETKEKTYPPERFVFPEEPRIGVFVCHCGVNIASVVDVEEVTSFAQGLPDVVYAGHNLFTCAQDTINRIVQIINEKGLNRVVVAACTPRTHEPLFQETLRAAGLNPFLFEMANIRDQDSWVHPDDPRRATEKAKELVAMAVSRVRLKRPVPLASIRVKRAALVIGGGLAGMQAALCLADQGFPVTLVEKSEELGGFARRLARQIHGKPIREFVKEVAARVEKHPQIDLRLGVTVKDVEGSVGNFQTILSDGNVVEHGVVVIATGAKPYVPQGRYAFGYGTDPRIKTNLEVDELLVRGVTELKGLKQVVFIQCVGSRNEEHPYCSRVCCTHTMEQIIELKKQAPELQVFVLCRDVRTFGSKELLYQKAREQGAVFLRYEPENPPIVETGEGLRVRARDHVLGREIVLKPDLLVLATGIVPHESSKELAKIYKCATTGEGFMLEAHLKLRPVDFATDGVFMAGLCHYPKFAEESLAQALAAASRAATILAREELPAESLVAEVDPRKCTACGQCVSLCPYHAPRLEEVKPFGLVSVINASLCKGCGNCAAACRCGAIQVKNLGEEPVIAAVEAAFGRIWY